jgi:hypothetical protein
MHYEKANQLKKDKLMKGCRIAAAPKQSGGTAQSRNKSGTKI